MTELHATPTIRPGDKIRKSSLRFLVKSLTRRQNAGYFSFGSSREILRLAVAFGQRRNPMLKEPRFVTAR